MLAELRADNLHMVESLRRAKRHPHVIIPKQPSFVSVVGSTVDDDRILRLKL